MSGPQIAVLVFIGADLLLFFVKDGQPRELPCYSFKWKVLDVAVLSALLYWGGFFAGGAK